MAISSNATGLRPGVCTSTTRPTTPYTGQIIYETDTGYLRVWDGSAWDYLSAKQDTAQALPVETYTGLVKVIPTSVSGTGVTLGATGTVSFSGATTVQINGCFTSQYDSYRVSFTSTAFSGNPNLYFQLSSGGTPTATNYFWSTYNTSNTGATGVSNASSGTTVNPAFCSSALPQGFQIVELNGPQATRNTTYTLTDNHNDTVGQIIRTGGGIHTDATSHDGIRFTVSTGTMGGTIVVYGYRN